LYATNQNRKSFFKTLGLLGTSALLSNKLEAFNFPSASVNTVKGNSKLNSKPLRMAHLTDIHVFPNKVAEYGMAQALIDVNESKNKVEFIVNGGDAILNKYEVTKSRIQAQWNTFHNVLKENNNLEIHHCIGNHDLYSFALPDYRHRDSKKWALQEYQIQSPYYSFTKQNWKFIVLDSIHGRNSVPGYYGNLGDEQYLWLEKELQDTPSDTFICIITHIPILAICTIFDGNNHADKKWNVPDNCLHADASKLTKLFYRFKNIKVCLSGHIHLIDHVNYLGIDYYCNGAVSGSWWNGTYLECDPAYAIMNFYADGTSGRELMNYNWKA